jgi:hypothetical protein
VTAKKLPGQLPTDYGPVPRIVYSVNEVAEMFGKAPSTIRMACFEHKLPYRLETTWGPGGRRFRRMVFSMREISALLDHYAPPEPGARRSGGFTSAAIDAPEGSR